MVCCSPILPSSVDSGRVTSAPSMESVPGASDVVVQDLQASVWFGDVVLVVRGEFRAVVRRGEHTGVGIMEQTYCISHSLQHSGLDLCKTHNYHFTLTIYKHTTITLHSRYTNTQLSLYNS